MTRLILVSSFAFSLAAATLLAAPVRAATSAQTPCPEQALSLAPCLKPLPPCPAPEAPCQR